ncbi:PP2C family protein-serine/threonine phosphatase [Streptomyces sp. B6B3]|uniref:PP2C family protein-serine/threonine phosphatase n=1 Tax=Streptomyces sp. B6B3 TaxID=3153570 RepID=UPI00325D1653
MGHEQQEEDEPPRGGAEDVTAADFAAMLTGLILAVHFTMLEQLPGVVAKHAARVGMRDVLIYLADLQQRSCVLLTEHEPPPGKDGEPRELALEGTVAGRAFQRGEILPASSVQQDPNQWWVPLLDGVERLGVMRISTTADSPTNMDDMRVLAGLVALLVVAKRGTSETHARLVRRRQMNVAAELQWRLMQPQTFATDRVVISAVMEPAYEVSGDAFDYSLTASNVYVSIFDAMGHDTAAGLTANLALASCRNSRRQGASLVQSAKAAEALLFEQFGGNRYVTSILADLELDTGLMRWISCGHHMPILIRGRTAVSLSCAPGLPIGIGGNLPITVCESQLQPGDRLVLYTDGITEARRPGGREFGLERFTDFLIRHQTDGLPVPETLRRLIRHHLHYHHGQLGDDATVLVLEWHGPEPYRPGEAADLVGVPEPEPAIRPVPK